ncbi:SDR family NAD(P)-dependent oxidoreductase [Dietzia sp. NPDC055340]
MSSLTDRVILITGAGRGQGLAHAEAAAASGAIVQMTDVDGERGEKEANRLRAAGLDATFHHLDVSDAQEWTSVVTDVIDRHGRIDGLVNNAGISLGGTVLDTTPEIWNAVIGVNQVGVWLGMATVAPHMVDARSGAIVNIASTLGKFASEVSFAYQATKGAVRMMSKSAALALGSHGIRVNTILPGLVDTDFIAKQKAAGAINQSVGRIPIGRIGEPAEISEAVLFLLSDGASYISGAELVVDGGLIAGSTGSLKPKVDPK